MTESDILFGKNLEIERMKSFGNFQPMTREDAKDYKYISARWKIQTRSTTVDGVVQTKARCRFVAREYRRGDPRGDLVVAASSSIASRLVTLKAQKEGLVRFTFDASKAFFRFGLRSSWRSWA